MVQLTKNKTELQTIADKKNLNCVLNRITNVSCCRVFLVCTSLTRHVTLHAAHQAPEITPKACSCHQFTSLFTVVALFQKICSAELSTFGILMSSHQLTFISSETSPYWKYEDANGIWQQRLQNRICILIEQIYFEHHVKDILSLQSLPMVPVTLTIKKCIEVWLC